MWLFDYLCTSGIITKKENDLSERDTKKYFYIDGGGKLVEKSVVAHNQ